MLTSSRATAGRVFRISSPTVGSRLTSQTSPRHIIIQKILPLEAGPLGQRSARLVTSAQSKGSLPHPPVFFLPGIVGVAEKFFTDQPACGFDDREPICIGQVLEFTDQLCCAHVFF